jgi:hypothetical protein
MRRKCFSSSYRQLCLTKASVRNNWQNTYITILPYIHLHLFVLGFFFNVGFTPLNNQLLSSQVTPSCSLNMPGSFFDWGCGQLNYY